MMDFAIFGNLFAIHYYVVHISLTKFFGSKYDNRIGNREIEDFRTAQKAIKDFWQQSMCQKSLFSVAFPILCSYPLYQISGLHVCINPSDTVLLKPPLLLRTSHTIPPTLRITAFRYTVGAGIAYGSLWGL